METNNTPPRSARIMTFRDLMEQRFETTGTCRFCKEYGKYGRYYSTRAFACNDCCESRLDEKLPMVAKREKAAQGYVANRLGEPFNCQFLSVLTGVTHEYAQWVIDREAAKRANAPHPGIEL
jgi:hypothetical protein